MRNVLETIITMMSAVYIVGIIAAVLMIVVFHMVITVHVLMNAAYPMVIIPLV